MLGLGAAWYLDLFLFFGFSLPFLCVWGVRRAQKGCFDAHRQWQRRLFVGATLAILALEAGIRLGGVGPGIEDSSFAGTSALRGLFLFHVVVASATWILWLFLVFLSSQRYGGTLPGVFSARHRLLGRCVGFGLAVSAISAGGVYVLGFVL